MPQVTVGPFLGINDAIALPAQDDKRAAALTNAIIPNPTIAGDVEARPGFQRVPLRTVLAGTAAVTAASASVAGTGTAWSTTLQTGDVVKWSYVLTGTVSVTASSVTVTGTSTAFLSDIAPAGSVTMAYLTIAGVTRRLSTVASNTSCATTVVWPTTVSGQTATLTVYRRVSTVTSDIAINVGDAAQVTRAGLTLTRCEGSGADAAVQWAGFHRTADGTAYNYALVSAPPPGLTSYNAFTDSASALGGLVLVRYVPGSARLVQAATTASMGGGLALSTARRIYGVSFAGYQILADQVNRPRKIDAATGTLSDLTALSVATWARPTVYYGKLFVVLDSTRTTLAWSNENDPDTGYGTANQWALRQTSSDGIEAIEGTNEALYVFRQNSVTSITGAVNTDFAAAGSVEGLSTDVGTVSPDAVVPYRGKVFFLDQQGRPAKVEPGRGVLNIADELTRETIPVMADVPKLRQASGRLVSAVGGNPLVVWARHLTDAATARQLVVAFDAVTEECVGTWVLPSTPDLSTLSIARDVNGSLVLMMGSATDTDAALYVQFAGNVANNHLDGVADGSTQTVQLTVDTPRMAGDLTTDKLFRRVDVGGRDVNGTEATLTFAYRTSYQPTAAYTAGVTLSSESVADNFPDRYCVGMAEQGRWLQARVQSATNAGLRVRVGEFVVDALPITTDPQAR